MQTEPHPKQLAAKHMTAHHPPALMNIACVCWRISASHTTIQIHCANVSLSQQLVDNPLPYIINMHIIYTSVVVVPYSKYTMRPCTLSSMIPENNTLITHTKCVNKLRVYGRKCALHTIVQSVACMTHIDV